jgi:hypothetical protein
VTLTIDKLCVRGKIPRRSNVDRALIDRVGREEFAIECGRQLNRPWPVQTRVTRIRQLRTRVSIPASQLRPDTLAKAWIAAFLRELFAALTNLNGYEILQFESRAEYLSAAIRDLLNGVTTHRWAYEEFERWFDIGTSEAVLTLFAREHSEIVPILLIMEDWGLLDRLLAIWNEPALERFFSIVAVETDGGDRRLSIEDLIIVAQLLLEHHSVHREMEVTGDQSLVTTKIALKFFLGLARKSDGRTVSIGSPQTIANALRMLSALLDLFKSAQARWPSRTGATEHSEDPSLAGPAVDIRSMIVAAGNEKPTAFTELLDAFRLIAGSHTRQNLLIECESIIAAGTLEGRTAFAELLEKLIPITKQQASVANTENGQERILEARWKSTDCAGLFLLISVLEKLGWEDRLTRSSLSATHGSRLLTYILAGVASAVLNRFDENPAHLDSGMALFAGWIDQPYLDGFRDFLASGSVEKRRDLLRELLGEETIEESSISWLSCFVALGNQLIQEFTKHIRCFGKPSQSFVAKNFVALPGRIRIEENRLVVIFDSSPLHIVLHLSGLDNPVEAVGWLGGRRIEFQAEGFS